MTFQAHCDLPSCNTSTHECGFTSHRLTVWDENWVTIYTAHDPSSGIDDRHYCSSAHAAQALQETPA